MDEKPFNPAEYLREIDGGDYLDVKWRVVWLRKEHPDAKIATELIDREPFVEAKSGVVFPGATFKATVDIPGGGSATGHGDESANHFKDYLTKAETKALGRALAALGYGAAFAADLDDGERIADAPVRRRGTKAARGANVVDLATADASALLSGKALYDLKEAAKLAGWNEAALASEAKRQFREADLMKLTVAQGRTLREWAETNPPVAPAVAASPRGAR
jgi:hypothetical protein